jgi:hypothetical protein
MFLRYVMILTMEAVRPSETSVFSNETTRRYISEGSHPLTSRCKNRNQFNNYFSYNVLQKLLHDPHIHYCSLIVNGADQQMKAGTTLASLVNLSVHELYKVSLQLMSSF